MARGKFVVVGSKLPEVNTKSFYRSFERGRTYAHFPPQPLASLVRLVSPVLVLLGQLLRLVVSDLDGVNARLSFLEANRTVPNVLSWKVIRRTISFARSNMNAEEPNTYHPSPSKPLGSLQDPRMRRNQT